MGSGNSKKSKNVTATKNQKKMQNAAIKIVANQQLKQIIPSVVTPGNQGKTLENFWNAPRHERAKYKQIIQENVLKSEPTPLDSQLVSDLLCGKALEVKESQPQLLRVFVSSTFTDTAMERNLLIADVYPYLKQFGRRYGFDFVPSEMRWGIREESSSDHMTSIICMAELERCRRESRGISYVAILCDKYGFRPFPSRIEENEFEQLLAQAKNDSDPNVNLLTEWFELNSNTVPGLYMLKPSTNAPKGEWWNIFEGIQMTLRKASKCLKDTERAKWYTVSVTEEEVHKGLLYCDDKNEATFMYRRKIEDIKNHADHKEAPKFIDKTWGPSGGVDNDAQTLLSKLQNESVPAVLKTDKIKDYTVPWGPGINLETHEEYLKDFTDHFCDLMVESMSEAIKKTHVVSDELYEEARDHALFCNNRSKGIFGRDEILEKIHGYAESNSKEPFVVHGASGCGKTSIIAKAILDLVPLGHVLIYRFLGTTLDSTNGRALLKSLCSQLRRVYDKDVNDIPNDFEKLTEQFNTDLKLATSSKPLIVILDSLDQLTDEDNARNLEWLPNELPKNVKIIVSTLPEVGGCLKKLQLALADDAFLQVPQLSAEDGKHILDSWLSTKKRALTATQMMEILDRFNKCPLPLYLKIAFETSLLWTSFTPFEETTLAVDIQGLINAIFDRLCRIHGDVLVSHALGYLTVGRYGLSGNELEDILSCDDEVLNDVFEWWTPPVRRLPPLLWVRIQSELEPYLVERGQDRGSPVLSWFHRQFREVSEKRFLSDPEQKKKYHSAIANYFLGRDAGESIPYMDKKGVSLTADRKIAPQPTILNKSSSQESSSESVQYNQRKLTELPTALIGAERWQMLADAVCYIEFIEAKCSVGLVYELQSEVAQGAKLAKAAGKAEVFQSLREWAKFLREKAATLSTYPQNVLQEAANYPDQTAPCRSAKIYMRFHAKGKQWLKFLNKPKTLSAKLMAIKWKRFSQAESASFSRDGKRLCAGVCTDTGRQYAFRIFDVETGALLLTTIHDSSFSFVEYTPDGKHIACALGNGKVVLLDSETGLAVKEFFDKKEGGKSVCQMNISPSGRHLAVAYSRESKRICIWDQEEGTIKWTLDTEFKSKANVVKFTPDGKYLITAEEDGIIRIWDATNDYCQIATGYSSALWSWADDIEKRKKNSQREKAQKHVQKQKNQQMVQMYKDKGGRDTTIPSGLYVGTYTLEGMEGVGGMSFPLMMLADGTIMGSGTDETGSFTLTGSFDKASGSITITQIYMEMYKSTYSGTLQCVNGAWMIQGSYNMPCGWVTYKGEFKCTIQEEYEKEEKDKEEEEEDEEEDDDDLPSEELEEEKLDLEKNRHSRIWGGDISQDGKLFVAACDDNTLQIFHLVGEPNDSADYDGQKEPAIGRRKTYLGFSAQGSTPKDVRFHPLNSDIVYGCGAHGSVFGFSIKTRKVVTTYFHGEVLHGLEINATGDILVSISSEQSGNYLMLWNTEADGADEMGVKAEDTKAMSVQGMEMSSDGTKLAVVIDNCDFVKILDTETGKLLTNIKEGTSYNECCFNPDASVVMIVRKSKLKFFDTSSGALLQEAKQVFGYEGAGATFNPNGNEFAVSGQENRYEGSQPSRYIIKIFSYPALTELRKSVPIHIGSGAHRRVIYSPDGSKLYSLGTLKSRSDHGLCVFDAQTLSKPIKMISLKFAYEFDIDHKNDQAIIGGGDGGIIIADLKTETVLKQFQPFTWRINGIRCCPQDERIIIAGSEDMTFKIINRETGAVMAYMLSDRAINNITVSYNSQKSAIYFAYGDQGTFVRTLQWVKN